MTRVRPPRPSPKTTTKSASLPTPNKQTKKNTHTHSSSSSNNNNNNNNNNNSSVQRLDVILATLTAITPSASSDDEWLKEWSLTNKKKKKKGFVLTSTTLSSHGICNLSEWEMYVSNSYLVVIPFVLFCWLYTSVSTLSGFRFCPEKGKKSNSAIAFLHFCLVL